ncbi:DnaJ C-terminal domain-containing protein [Aquincola tertiaricarbonis]|uniref:DnaJ C-terminal domain-containing protein n=1 Tax=Aquincola tertiaricarbonis TaxID=391953 RepID=UPI00061510F2|nr:DnaJ C-terminal domain-containing protein [Aquincola tertiaricarbonis]
MSTETAALEELGLRPGASEAEIKAAWRKLVSRWHPDRNASRAAVEKMQRINQAFELLRGAGAAAAPVRPAEPAAPAAAPSPPPARKAPAGEAARPLSRRIKLTLEEAALGCLRVLRGQVAQGCTACAGQGLRWPGGACASCEGRGEVRQRAWYGWLATTATCEDCGGDGRARERCAPCEGSGKLPPRRYELKVRIPPGVRDGDLLGVPAGRAEASPEGGVDLHIELQPHAFFTLDDDGTVRCEMPVDGFSWLGGRSVEVPTLEGTQPLALRHGECVYRLRGQGFPASRRGARADLVVTVMPIFPQPLSTDQQILLDRLIATTASASTGPLADWQRRLRARVAADAPADPPLKAARRRTSRA